MTLMPLKGLKMALKSWLSFNRSKVNFTSAEVNSLPEWNFTPLRSLKRMVFSSTRSQLSARRGSKPRSCVQRINGSNVIWDNCKMRSEEHTSELQSRENLVCLLLLEKN